MDPRIKGFGAWNIERERLDVGGSKQIFLTLFLQLEGLLYRHKRVEKRGKNGGEMKFKFPPKIGLKGG